MTTGSDKVKLSEVAIVRSGLVLSRKQAKDITPYKYLLLNLKCIDDKGYINIQQADVFHAKEILSQEYITKPGDIVVRLSSPYTAVLIDETTAGMVISSYFIIIRTDKMFLLPEYLFWLLNTKEEKRKIFKSTTTNMLSAITTNYFSEMMIDDVSIEKQAMVAEMNRLSRRESFLLRQLAEEKEKYYAHIIKMARK